MLSVHPSPRFSPSNTHTHIQKLTHTHIVAAHPPYLPCLWNIFFCSILRHFKNLCSKHSPYCNQFISFVQLCPTLCNPMCDCSTSGFLVHQQLAELAETQVHGIPNAIQPSNPLSYPSPWPSFLPSIRIFSSETVDCIRWTKYWSCSFSISPSNE